MESAIPPHLTCPRSHAPRAADDYVPPYPAWTARSEPPVERVVMGYFGVQWGEDAHAGTGVAAAEDLLGRLTADGSAFNVERTRFRDAAGYDNILAIAYWRSPADHDRWWESHAGWWASPDRETGPIGFYREIFSPRAERFETLYSGGDQLDGVGAMLGRVSNGDVREHGYWGSMRDRIPASQTSALDPSGALSTLSTGKRRVVNGHEHVALIRSGQDWTRVKGEEKALYEARMQPTLEAGMDFLRDEGGPIGCYFNRYMRHIDATGTPLDRSFGMSCWRSLGHLERWAEHHPTHEAIFGGFMTIVQALQGQLDLRLYHEVAAFTADEQLYDYIGCHPRTGMLNGLEGA